MPFFGNTKQYRKSKRLSKRVKEVPNLAQTGSHIAADGIGCKWEGKAHHSFNISYTKTYRYRGGVRVDLYVCCIALKYVVMISDG